MKNILVPIDFSENSLFALEYAVDISNHFASNLTILYAYELHSTSGSLSSIERIIRQDAEADMAQLKRKYQPQLKKKKSIQTKVILGNPVSVIVNQADKLNFDLVVMGTQGASGLLEIFLGSTTNGVIKRAKTPILAIPSHESEIKTFQTVVLAVDDSEISVHASLNPLVELAKEYSSNILVYHQLQGIQDRGIDIEIGKVLKSIKHSYHFQSCDISVNESIRRFVSYRNADLLCMIRRNRRFPEWLFHASATTKEVFNISMPLLILHDGQ